MLGCFSSCIATNIFAGGKKKKKKKIEFLPSTKKLNQKKFFSNQLHQLNLIKVRLVPTHEQCSCRTPFWGNKNYVPYPTPLITLEMSNKERANVDAIFCLPLICVLDPKNSKNVNISPRGCRNI